MQQPPLYWGVGSSTIPHYLIISDPLTKKDCQNAQKKHYELLT